MVLLLYKKKTQPKPLWKTTYVSSW